MPKPRLMMRVVVSAEAAMLTMLIRVSGNLPEGVVFSIVIMNFMVPLIDGAIKGKTTTKVWKSWLTVGIAVVIAVLVVVIVIMSKKMKAKE